jgi:hypothetical protein
MHLQRKKGEPKIKPLRSGSPVIDIAPSRRRAGA